MNDLSKVEGGLLRLLIGDALGVPYEFHAASEIPDAQHIEFEPPQDLLRSHDGVPPGTWSDDGAQALCLLASLLHCGTLDPADFGRRLLNWSRYGYMAVDNEVFDIGFTTSEALARLERDCDPLKAGPHDEMSNGNGSLMRVLPLALWHRGPDRELVEFAVAQSCLTHGHPRSQVCCALYCLWARCYLEDDATPWRNAVKRLRAVLHRDSALFEELEAQVRPDENIAGTGTGYVVDSLHSARELMVQASYESVARGAVQLGSDTDTTACIAGGIAGIRDGVAGIPKRWRDALRGKSIYQPVLAALIEHLELPAVKT